MIDTVILACAISLILIFVLIILIRTFRFKAFTDMRENSKEIAVDEDKAFYDLSEMIKCKTISHFDKVSEDESEFTKFKHLLPVLFPNIFEKCEYKEIGKRALLFKYPGKESGSPLVLMSHYDVVSVEESKWSKPPFEGVIEDGYLFGRGTLDTKGTLNAAMQALEQLIKEDFVPEHDIYLAFAGDEEINGGGAPSIVDIFEKEGIDPIAVLDEGGAVVDNVFPGVSMPCALVGIAEKGMLNVSFAYSGNGGHASSPKAHTPIGKLSAACVKVENNPFKFRITTPTRLMFNKIARHSSFLYRMIFANLWLFSPILNRICKKNGGEINALVRTTCAFTQMEGSKGMNVIPASCKMVANLRILPGETTESAIEYLKNTIDDDEIKIEKINSILPSRISDTDSIGYEKITNTITETWNNVIVSPYLMFACSDSRHWGRISDKVYRFSAMTMTSEERATIHGNDEKIHKSVLKKTVEFYIRLIKKF